MNRSVTIGLPTYNRPDLLRIAVASLLAQTHRDLKILISDNASTDPRVAVALAELAAADPRVSYVVAARNQGAVANFQAVTRSIDTPYFMWASDDDIWDPRFVGRCLELLDHNPLAQMAFTSIDNINDAGDPIRAYPGFADFTSTTDRRGDAIRYLLAPEVMGKANLFYGLFRTPAFVQVMNECWDTAAVGDWCGDCVFVFAFLSRYPIVATDDVLLHKRMPTGSPDPVTIRDPRTYVVAPWHMASYLRRHQAVSPDPATAAAVRRAFTRKISASYVAAGTNGAFWAQMSRTVRSRLSKFANRRPGAG